MSFRTRVAVLVAGVVAIAVAGVAGTFLYFARAKAIESLDEQLKRMQEDLQDQIARDQSDMDDMPEWRKKAMNRGQKNSLNGAFQAAGKQIVVSISTFVPVKQLCLAFKPI